MRRFIHFIRAFMRWSSAMDQIAGNTDDVRFSVLQGSDYLIKRLSMEITDQCNGYILFCGKCVVCNDHTDSLN